MRIAEVFTSLGRLFLCTCSTSTIPGPPTTPLINRSSWPGWRYSNVSLIGFRKAWTGLRSVYGQLARSRWNSEVPTYSADDVIGAASANLTVSQRTRMPSAFCRRLRTLTCLELSFTALQSRQLIRWSTRSNRYAIASIGFWDAFTKEGTRNADSSSSTSLRTRHRFRRLRVIFDPQVTVGVSFTISQTCRSS